MNSDGCSICMTYFIVKYTNSYICNRFPFFQWTLVIRNHPMHPSGTMVIQLEYHCLSICCSNFRTTLARPLNFPAVVINLRTDSMWWCCSWIPSSIWRVSLMCIDSAWQSIILAGDTHSSITDPITPKMPPYLLYINPKKMPTCQLLDPNFIFSLKIMKLPRIFKFWNVDTPKPENAEKNWPGRPNCPNWPSDWSSNWPNFFHI